MKKILFAAAVVLTASFTACTKENGVQPTAVKAKTLADDNQKNDLSQADGAKNDLSQADGASN